MAAAALFAACKAGDAACVRAELARPGAAALVNAKDVAYVRVPAATHHAPRALTRVVPPQFGSTPLHYAAAGGHADVAKALIEWGADARATDAVRHGAAGRSGRCSGGRMRGACFRDAFRVAGAR